MRRALGALLLWACAGLAGCVCAPGEIYCNGGCRQPQSDEQACGACNVRCRGGQRCIRGQCQPWDLRGECTSDASCGDGRGCNGVERCVEGSCRRGAPPPCDDGVACTEEDCREPGVCVSIPDSSYCDDGETCTGQGPTGCR